MNSPDRSVTSGGATSGILARPMQAAFAFAPTQPGQRTLLYYGRRNDEPTVFVIRRELFEELTQPVLKIPTEDQSSAEPPR